MEPIRFSRLKLMALSPYHYWSALQTDASVDTASTRLGSAAHAVVFGQPYAVFDGVRRGKEWEAFQADHAGVVLMNRKEYDDAVRIAEGINAHTLARKLLSAPNIETRISWEQNGMPCSGTPDAWSSEYVVDLKTTRCAEPERFMRDAGFRAYHAQVAWYLDGLAQADPTSAPRRAYLVAVENSAPYAVSVIELDATALDAGRRLYRTWMERLKVCEESGVWPGYAAGAVPWTMPEPLDFGDEPESEDP